MGLAHHGPRRFSRPYADFLCKLQVPRSERALRLSFVPLQGIAAAIAWPASMVASARAARSGAPVGTASPADRILSRLRSRCAHLAARAARAAVLTLYSAQRDRQPARANWRAPRLQIRALAQVERASAAASPLPLRLRPLPRWPGAQAALAADQPEAFAIRQGRQAGDGSAPGRL